MRPVFLESGRVFRSLNWRSRVSRISAIVITRNEEANIEACLSTLAWADEIVVLDSYSEDRTVDLGRKYTDKVFKRRFTTFPEQRNASLELAGGSWAFFLDADERVTPELATEIRRVINDSGESDASGDKKVGYWVPRKNFILGRCVRYAGWWPDYQMRLFQRAKGRYDVSVDPHEVVLLDGRDGHLTAPVVHYNYTSVKQIVVKQTVYAEREASSLRRAGIRNKPRWLISRPLRELYFRYIILKGYKDGWLGLFLCLVMAWYRLLVHIKLARL